MKRTILNVLALAMILGGATHLNASVNPEPFCCVSGTVECCGPKGCEIGQNGCHAW
jgi:hypothetical protein